MHFKAHYLALSTTARDDLARRAGTTRGTLNQVVYAGKEIELGLADCLVALCQGVELADLPLTERAKHQHAVRTEAPPAEQAEQGG